MFKEGIMKKLFVVVVFTVLALVSTAAFSQVPVNIVYPINGAIYPRADISPASIVLSAYITASFGVTCAGGEQNVEWGFDDMSVGKEVFYDQASVQSVYKLPSGKHSFWVKSNCGSDVVYFSIE
jgi:hypothetical protein